MDIDSYESHIDVQKCWIQNQSKHRFGVFDVLIIAHPYNTDQ